MTTNPKTLSLTLITVTIASSLFAAEPTPSEKTAPPAQPNYTLVFSDDFSTDPNTNGKWTVFRRQGDLSKEGFWSSSAQAWFLTRQSLNLATAAFANYELTATTWKVDFRYKVNNGPGGADGFIFMFYKDKGAYGTPDSGSYMAFQTRNPDNSKNPVAGYGLQFDTFQYTGCDPLTRQNYVALVKDVICDSARVYAPFDEIDDNVWHSVEFRFTEGRMACVIDGTTLQGLTLSDPDYTHTGIGFGAGTGAQVSDQVIDDFQVWVAE